MLSFNLLDIVGGMTFEIDFEILADAGFDLIP